MATVQDCIHIEEVTGQQLTTTVRDITSSGECKVVSITKTKERMINADYLVVYEKPVADELSAAAIPCTDPLVNDDYE